MDNLRYLNYDVVDDDISLSYTLQNLPSKRHLVSIILYPLTKKEKGRTSYGRITLYTEKISENNNKKSIKTPR